MTQCYADADDGKTFDPDVIDQIKASLAKYVTEPADMLDLEVDVKTTMLTFKLKMKPAKREGFYL